MMRIGSLFSGIGGLELGLELATGGHTVWQVEADPFARAVLAKHWPGADRSVSDVREATAYNLAPVELICGGFPCQDVSNAGKRKGVLNGERSGLWAEFARIIRTLRPRFVVVENVAALRSRGLGVVLRDLAISGYDAEWGVLSAAGVGAPHLRKRLFIVAWRQPDSHDVARDVADTDVTRPQVGSDIESPHQFSAVVRGDWWSAEPEVGRVVDGFPGRVDRLRCLGNAVVPAVAYQVGLRVQRMMEAA